MIQATVKRELPCEYCGHYGHPMDFKAKRETDHEYNFYVPQTCPWCNQGFMAFDTSLVIRVYISDA